MAGSRLDAQTADFARRAAELWTQAAGLRELTSGQQGQEGNGSDGGTAALAVALDQVNGVRVAAGVKVLRPGPIEGHPVSVSVEQSCYIYYLRADR